LRKFEGSGGRSGKAEGFRTLTFNRAKGFHGEIGTDVPYAELHEFGTGRLRERAFVNPAMQDVVNRVAASIIEQEMGRAMKKEGW